MTHDELLALIAPMTNDDAIFMKDALCALMELHKPFMGFTGGYDGEENELWEEQCQECSNNGFSQTYPCPTIQAIEKELE